MGINVCTSYLFLTTVLDSFGKPTPGTLFRNTPWLGHFDECMNITDFRYCLADMRLNVTFNVSDTLGLPSVSYSIVTAYTFWPEFTKEVYRQTEVYVRHTTRFDAFFQTLVFFLKQKEVCRNKRRFVDKPPL